MIFVLCCFLTVLIETAFMAVFGYRSRFEIKIIICANILTNLSMNMLFWLLEYYAPGRAPVLVFELAVFVSEYLIYGGLFGRSRRLFLLTLVANAVSYGSGLLLFGGY